jgi:ubiquinone/menaquinone biosynthesis C-methylase UbiE
VSADRIIPLYERTAAAWDAARGRTLHIEGAWLDRFAAAAREGGTVLDLGCGTASRSRARCSRAASASPASTPRRR